MSRGRPTIVSRKNVPCILTKKREETFFFWLILRANQLKVCVPSRGLYQITMSTRKSFFLAVQYLRGPNGRDKESQFSGAGCAATLLRCALSLAALCIGASCLILDEEKRREPRAAQRRSSSSHKSQPQRINRPRGVCIVACAAAA